MNAIPKVFLATWLSCWLFLLVEDDTAAQRPRYGGTFRIKLQIATRSLDPEKVASDPAERATQAKLLSLVFEPLVRLDPTGVPTPALATSWTHTADYRTWSFDLRRGVCFHDGVMLTPAAVASALKSAEVGLRISASSETVAFQCERPLPELPQRLARHFVFKRASDDKIFGTGPFRVVEWTPGRMGRLVAHEEHWLGRPFLDAVEIEMGRSLRDQFSDLELARADFVEISPSQLRSAMQRGYSLWSTAPTELWALVFRQDSGLDGSARLREVLALSIDRSSIHSVLLQKQGEPTGALLPQWLSGYSFLFPTELNLERARMLRAGTTPNVQTFALAFSASDPLERAVAERISVNAREAGLLLKLFPQPPSTQPSVSAGGFDLRLERVSLSTWSPAEALTEVVKALRLSTRLPPADSTTPDLLYVTEQKLLEGRRVIPLFHLPVIYALNPRVIKAFSHVSSSLPFRPWQGWPLEDLWLVTERKGLDLATKP